MDPLVKKIREGKCKELILRKDIVIPAGTTLRMMTPNSKRILHGNGHYEGEFSMSRDSWGDITYHVDPSSEEDIEQLINKWFIVI